MVTRLITRDSKLGAGAGGSCANERNNGGPRGDRNAEGGEIAAKKNEHHFSLTQFLSTVSHGYEWEPPSPMLRPYVRYGRDL